AKRIEAIATKHSYSVSAELFYEDHIPLVGYLFIKGKGRLFKKRRKDIPLNPGDLIGLIELMDHTPSNYGAAVEENTTVVFLDKSTILEVIEEEIDEDLKSIFESFLVNS
ncbi:MAG: cyclic nucleotide-binding domain-containing protein, partial [Halobacteriovoraceae bacterium]|nr:cyclic nucleotide-binding domain-containing protein [Halobacteriovoraceae bacterium]